MRKILATLFALLCACRAAQAELRLPHLLSDHAVLQRDRPAHLWGWAAPGATLTLRLHGQTVDAVADALGKWSATLMPEPAGGPYTLTVDGDGHAEVRDVMPGDVWFASGQSNMEMPLKGFGPGTPVKNSAAEIAAATHLDLRLLLAEHRSSDVPVDDLNGTWSRCTPETAANFSAVAYFFGREIAAREHVTVGLIDATWGGTPADVWVSLDTLARDPLLLSAFRARAEFAATQADDLAMLAEEKREDTAATAAGKPAPAHAWHPDPASWNPAGLYNGMIAPLTPLSIKGVLWYQGETNSGNSRIATYQALFAAHIADWRTHFAQGNFPFLFAQISAFDSPPEEHWGAAREVQRRTLDVAHTAMAVTLDTGEQHNGHPANKQAVGHRLALAARSLAYNEPVHAAGPLFARADRESSPGQSAALRVRFQQPAERLSCPANTCRGFELAGEDHHFHPATAIIQADRDDNSVLVTAPAVPSPVYVRYAWPSWTDANLIDADGLPASTFSSEPSFNGAAN